MPLHFGSVTLLAVIRLGFVQPLFGGEVLIQLLISTFCRIFHVFR